MSEPNQSAHDRGNLHGSRCDLSTALTRMDGAEDLLCDVIDVFLEDYQSSVVQLRRAGASGSIPDFERAAHTIKGAASNFAATSTVNLALRAETLCRQGNLSEAIQLMPAIEAEIEALAQELRAYRNRREAA